MKIKAEKTKRVASAIMDTLKESGVKKANNKIQKKTKSLAKEVAKILATEEKKWKKMGNKNKNKTSSSAPASDKKTLTASPGKNNPEVLIKKNTPSFESKTIAKLKVPETTTEEI